MIQGGLKLIVIAGQDLENRLERHCGPSDQVLRFADVATAVAELRGDLRNAFNIDALLVGQGTGEDLDALLNFAPHAARVFIGDRGKTTLQSAVCVSPASLREGEPLAWLRAGLLANRASRAPSAKLFVHRPTRSVLSANDAALELMRCESFEGGPLSQILGLPEEAFERESWRGTVEGTDSVILGVTARQLSDAWLFVALSDITDVEVDRANHRQEENLMLLGRAAAVLAHEIGNPLAAIKANLQLLSSEYDRLAAASVEQYLGRSLSEVSRLSGIVTNYLSMVREPTLEVNSLRGLVESAFAQVGDMFRAVRIEWEVDDIPETIRVHFASSQFHQIAWNVGKNAVDSMLRSPVARPFFRVHVLSVDAHHVKLCFDDNGEGLPVGQSDRLFDAFVTTKGSGTGLGLMVCRLLARQFGGDIEMVRLESGARALLRMRIAHTQ